MTRLAVDRPQVRFVISATMRDRNHMIDVVRAAAMADVADAAMPAHHTTVAFRLLASAQTRRSSRPWLALMRIAPTVAMISQHRATGFAADFQAAM
jgi:hypothetical protein